MKKKVSAPSDLWKNHFTFFFLIAQIWECGCPFSVLLLKNGSEVFLLHWKLHNRIQYRSWLLCQSVVFRQIMTAFKTNLIYTADSSGLVLISTHFKDYHLKENLLPYPQTLNHAVKTRMSVVHYSSNSGFNALKSVEPLFVWSFVSTLTTKSLVPG